MSQRNHITAGRAKKYAVHLMKVFPCIQDWDATARRIILYVPAEDADAFVRVLAGAFPGESFTLGVRYTDTGSMLYSFSLHSAQIDALISRYENPSASE